MINKNSRVSCDEELMKSLKNIGLNENNENVRGFFGERDLFQDIPIYIKIQKQIEQVNNHV